DICAGDYNGDGILDIAITGWPGVLEIYKGSAGGFFTKMYSGSEFQYSSLSWVDLDADGDLDLFVSGYVQPSLKTVCVYNTAGGFVEEQFPLPGFQSGDIAFEDYNQDGWPDLAITGEIDLSATVKSAVYKNLGYGEFEETVFISTSVQNGSLAWFDYDADGDSDLFISGYEKFATPEERLYVYKNSGSPNYDLEFSTWLPCVVNGKIVCGDINNNGYGDVFLVGESASVAGAFFYEYNSATAKFELGQSLPPLGKGSLAAFADYDGDGDIDLFYCGQDTNTLSGKSFLFENKCVSTNAAPSAASNLNADVAAGYLVLGWDAPSDDWTFPAALNYSLMIATVTKSSSTLSGCIASPFRGYNAPCHIAGSPSTIFAGIVEGTTYFWNVRAIDAAGKVGPWAEEQVVYVSGVPPSAISNLTALPGAIDGVITLKWTAPGNDGTFGKCSSYRVKYSSVVGTVSDETEFNSASAWAQAWKPKIGGWVESKTLTGLRPGVTYYFGIKGTDGFSYGTWGTGGSANIKHFAPAQNIVPSSPTWPGSNYVVPGDSCINLKWNLNTAIDISSYTVEMSTEGGSFGHVVSTSHPNNSLSVTGLTNFVTYYFRLSAIDWTGYISTWSAVKGGYPRDTSPPNTVTDLAAERSSPGTTLLSWTAPGDSWNTNDNLIGGKYEIACATYSFAASTGAFASNLRLELSTSVAKGTYVSSAITGLSHDTTYYFRLRTADEVPNWSGISNISYAKTVDTAPPAAVTALTGATGFNAGVVDLSWISSGDNEWSGNLTGNFKIDYATYSLSLSSQTAKKIISASNLSSGTLVSYSVGGLLAGASYYFRLWSFDEENNSSYASNIATASAQADSNPPDVRILIPVSSSPLKSYGCLSLISGTAVDDYGDVREVSVSTGGSSGPWHLAQISGADWSFDCATFTFISGGNHTILARAKDSYGNETSSYTVGVSSVNFYYDNSPPNEVSDLTASTGSLSGYIELAWTSPHDNPAQDTVAGYILKYATYTLADTTAWWEQALELASPAPAAAGAAEHMTVTGLDSGSTYWFALKSYDGVDYYNSTSAVSNSALCMARYGPDAVTKFRINIATAIVKGVPAAFSVLCHNPHYESVPASSAVISVSFSGAGCEFYPSSYDFALGDGGTKTFSNCVIFTGFGDKTFQVASGGIISYSAAVRVSSAPSSSVGASGGVVWAASNIKLVIPPGAMPSNKTLRLDMLTDNADIPSYAGSTITASACEIKQLSGEDIIFNTAATLTLSFLDNDNDTNEDKTGVSENSLGLFFYDGKLWRILDEGAGLSASSVATGNVFVSKVYRTGKYAIFPRAGVSRSISGVKPKRKIITPYSAGSNDAIEFTGATEPFTVQVYSASGKKVFEGQNCYTWAGVTTSGAKVPGGIYFYEMVSPAGTITGAVVVAK
ncbi:VCBS repeat-containing protein, partial [bacterium]|nr:VCBS repeat-containing protein [bacterium]